MTETAATTSNANTPYFLLLEDSAGEAELFCQALSVAWKSLQSRIQVAQPRIEVRQTAKMALEFLRSQLEGSPISLPKLVVLDLDLPGETSLAFLREVRRDTRLRNLPVMVMAWSEDEGSAQSLAALGISTCVIKPMVFSELVTLVHRLCRHVLSTMPDHEICGQDLVSPA